MEYGNATKVLDAFRRTFMLLIADSETPVKVLAIMAIGGRSLVNEK